MCRVANGANSTGAVSPDLKTADAIAMRRARAELLGAELERVVVEAKKLGLGLDEVQAGLAAHWKKLGGK